MGNKFDFETANLLIEVVGTTTTNLNDQNAQMEKRFGDLRSFFRDDGYDSFTGDMSVANSSIKSLLEQMRAVSRSLAEYAKRLKDSM